MLSWQKRRQYNEKSSYPTTSRIDPNAEEVGEMIVSETSILLWSFEVFTGDHISGQRQCTFIKAVFGQKTNTTLKHSLNFS